MNIWWTIFLAGVGTYLMRSAGVWVSPKFSQARGLDHLPFAVILVLSVSSILSLSETNQAAVGAIAATLAVIIASLRKLPLVFCIALGCIVFGALSGNSGSN